MLTLLQLTLRSLQYNATTYPTYDTNACTIYNVIRLPVLLMLLALFNFTAVGALRQ